MSKVIHVHLIFEKKNIYFGSISAIFETLTEKQVGITKSSLLHAGLTDVSSSAPITGAMYWPNSISPASRCWMKENCQPPRSV